MSAVVYNMVNLYDAVFAVSAANSMHIVRVG